MEHSDYLPSNKEPKTNTDFIVLRRNFVVASGFASIFTFLATLFYVLITVQMIAPELFRWIPMENNAVDNLFFFATAFVFAILFPDQFLASYKVKILNNKESQKEYPLTGLTPIWHLSRAGQLKGVSSETVLFTINGFLRFIAVILFPSGKLVVVGYALIIAGFSRITLYFVAQQRVNNDLPKIYSFLIFLLSAAIELILGLFLVLNQIFLNWNDSETFSLIYAIIAFALIGIQKIVKWAEDSTIEQIKYMAMTEDLKGRLKSKDPTFGDVVAELPRTLFRLSVLQKVILYSAYSLAVVVYGLVVIFLSLGLDPFENPAQFSLWFIPLAVSTLAVLLIISKTEAARVETRFLFIQLERALETFEKTNEKYLVILEEE